MAPLLDMRGITKAYPGVRALDGVDLTLKSGEVLALLGENGAGKSTLIKILAGAQRPDAGSIHLAGQPLTLDSPARARRAGIAVIHQEFSLIPTLSAVENLFLGAETSTAGFLHPRAEERRARALFERLGVHFNLHAPCRTLTVAQQQSVEIAKALLGQSRIVVMDEPSAALTPGEVDRLFTIIRDLRAQGIGILYVSHRLDEIFDLADRVTVLRDGRHIATAPIAEVTRAQLIQWMVGRRLEQEFPRRTAALGAVRLRAEHLRREPRVRDVSLQVRAGEIVALTGLVGAGRTETARLLFGADRAEEGVIHLDGRRLHLRSPADAIRAGICLLTEDRKHQGLILGHSVRENFGLPNLRFWSRFGWVRRRRERTALRGFVDRLRIKLPNDDQLVRHLSGGNQQKVVLAKWLQADAALLIFDEPTRGIDVGAKAEIYQLMNELAAQGKAILMISSELPEALGMADRILVMHEGRIKGEIADVAHATQEDILRLAVG
jgi:ABC-type sugar transport system ATPase subunit